MKFAYLNKELGPESRVIIQIANRVIARFQAQGYRMTLRQLYYQFIAQDLFPPSWADAGYNAKNGLPPDTKNTEKNYKRLGDIISQARLSGFVDWEAIEDRNRQPSIPLEFRSLAHRVESALANYRLPRWANQDFYVELWVEKAALAGVLEPIARELHVTLMVNRGYSSQSAMFESAQRFREQMECDGQPEPWDRRLHGPREGYDPCYNVRSQRRGRLLYLGDHDPSGEDMVRDIDDRMRMFGVGPFDKFDVVKVALTSEQVQKYAPPPNPAKVTDPRAKKYIEKFGPTSWEVDALDPPVLYQLITDQIRDVIDPTRLERVLKKEQKDKAQLNRALQSVTRRKP